MHYGLYNRVPHKRDLTLISTYGQKGNIPEILEKIKYHSSFRNEKKRLRQENNVV